jgi:hypothetical protein
MSGPSFRSSFVQVVSRPGIRGSACLLGVLALAGCGGGETAPATVRGDGYSFAAPAGWRVTRSGSSVAAEHGTDAVSITTFRLTKPYTAKLWNEAVAELDGVAAKLAAELHGSVSASRTVNAGGGAARQYDLAFTKDGHQLVERITFALRGRREYELLCRYEAGKHEPACERLLVSFRPV